MKESEEEKEKTGQREEEKKHEGEKEENETVSAQRRCVGLVSAEALDIFCQVGVKGKNWRVVVVFLGRNSLEELVDLSDCVF